MENRELDLLSIIYLCDKLIIPCWAVGLLPGGGLAHTGIINIEGNVCVQQESLGLGANGVPQWPWCGLQVQSFADFYLQQAVENNHDDARTGNCLPSQCQTLILRKCFACSYHHVISKDQFQWMLLWFLKYIYIYISTIQWPRLSGNECSANERKRNKQEKQGLWFSCFCLRSWMRVNKRFPSPLCVSSVSDQNLGGVLFYKR